MEHKDTKPQSTFSQEEFEKLNKLSHEVLAAAITVHKELGAGLLESVYQECLKAELKSMGYKVETEVEFPLIYKGIETEKIFRVDMIVEDAFLVELKAVEEIKPIHEVQLVTYMKLLGIHMGFLLNFNVPYLKDGVRRKINGYVRGK